MADSFNKTKRKKQRSINVTKKTVVSNKSSSHHSEKNKKTKISSNHLLNKLKRSKDFPLTPVPADEKNKKVQDNVQTALSFKALANETNTNNYAWGLGVEHEMQLFHVPPSGMKNANILFDSQESTCFLTGDYEESGSCTKLRKTGEEYYAPSVKDRKILSKKDQLTDEEYKWLLSTDWELTGRQAAGCEGGSSILARTPVLMPELITGSHKNRTIDSIHREIIFLEEKFIKLQMKNPITRNKVAKYGPLKPHACNFLSDIKVPVRPTINSDEYQFEGDHDFRDYLGSYHITITLPHLPTVETHDFVNLHRYFGMQFQWIEPLINGVYFSPDPDSVGSGPNKVKGSARIMLVGWGTLGGSDLRKLGATKPGQKVPFAEYGIGRASNIKADWQDAVDFPDAEKIKTCVKTAPPLARYAKYPGKALSINTSDVRTFNFEHDRKKCEELSNPSDCPRVDAAPMEPPYGMELRIFDHFDVKYLLDLMKVLVLLAANGQRHNPTDYVQKDKAWIDAVKSSMQDGWNASLSPDYINALQKNLGLKLDCQSNRLDHVYDVLIKELHQLNHKNYICQLMMEEPDKEPKSHPVNRYCWELSFNKKFRKPVIDFLKKVYRKGQGVSLSQFKRDFFKNFEEYLWRDDVEDLLFALETSHKVSLETEKGKIIKVKILVD
jgi:hypothetical protein